KGSFAIALIHKNHPDQIVAAARECPLSIGRDEKKMQSIISSDPNAFLNLSLHVLFLRNDEIAKVQKGHIEVFDSALKCISKRVVRLEVDDKAPSKVVFERFVLKEIFEQPATVQTAPLGRFEEGNIEFE